MKAKKDIICFLYQSLPGRVILKVLVRPSVSKMLGAFLSSRFSGWLAPLFIWKHRIDMTDYAGQRYRSFNDFFTRYRIPADIDITPDHLISPCDGYLSIYPVSGKKSYRVKHIEYRLKDLLRDSALAEQFSGGTCLIFRMTPENYHRYCYVCDGIRTEFRKIQGILHCVRPAAYTTVPVFVENSREYTRIRTLRFGDVIQMEIGALLVGKIHNHQGETTVLQGQEKGYFEFGGSTVLVLAEKNRIQMDGRFKSKLHNGQEVKVRMGEKIGVWISEEV